MIAWTKPQVSLAAVLLINKLVFYEPKLDKNICINYAVKSFLIERFQYSKKGKDKNIKKKSWWWEGPIRVDRFLCTLQ